jgi:hypothetical protein
MRLDSAGTVRWQERLVFPEYPSMLPGELGAAAEAADGTILISGKTGVLPPDYHFPGDWPLLVALERDGTPRWGQLINGLSVGRSDGVITDVFPLQGGIALASNGSDPYVGANGVAGPSLTSLDLAGNAPTSCSNYPITVIAQQTSYVVQDRPSAPPSEKSLSFTRTQVVPIDLKDAKDYVPCGQAYPGITSIATMQSPFQLQLRGWNFQEGCTVLIKSVSAPNTKYKGTDKLGRTTLVAGGSGLKAMLPKGQPVCITVLNPDGRESVCFQYTR